MNIKYPKNPKRINLVNNQNLPQVIVNAVANDDYDSSGSDISTTKLIKPPRIVLLESRHYAELEEDVADRIFSLLGQSVHTVLERAKSKKDIVERRLFYNGPETNGWTLSGQLDMLDSKGQLMDFKITSAWTALDAQQNGKPEWEQQLNILDFLCKKNPENLKVFGKLLQPKSLSIIAILRDWSKLRIMHSDNYPKKQVVVIPIRRWSTQEQAKFVAERVGLHQRAASGVDVPVCTPQERWRKEDTYAIMKHGRKSAVRVLQTKKQATAYLKQNELVEGKHYKIIERKGEDVRCENYCLVKNFCDYYTEKKIEF
tara:strand:+ start:1461 stop:2402 length:942 start_codon:yes stop_codon:yes gene_type:complete